MIDSLQQAGVEVVPAKHNIFAALPESPGDVKVIFVGQDPYPTMCHATGLAFSVPQGTKQLPPTLRNVLHELHEDVHQSTATRDDLTHWRNQGVLLLNRVLTTETGSSLAHKEIGWQKITLEIVRAIRKANSEVVGVLWGKQAGELTTEFAPGRVIASVHPSPLSAYRGFFGSKPFSRVNEILLASGQSAVNW